MNVRDPGRHNLRDDRVEHLAEIADAGARAPPPRTGIGLFDGVGEHLAQHADGMRWPAREYLAGPRFRGPRTNSTANNRSGMAAAERDDGPGHGLAPPGAGWCCGRPGKPAALEAIAASIVSQHGHQQGLDRQPGDAPRIIQARRDHPLQQTPSLRRRRSTSARGRKSIVPGRRRWWPINAAHRRRGSAARAGVLCVRGGDGRAFGEVGTLARTGRRLRAGSTRW